MRAHVFYSIRCTDRTKILVRVWSVQEGECVCPPRTAVKATLLASVQKNVHQTLNRFVAFITESSTTDAKCTGTHAHTT